MKINFSKIFALSAVTALFIIYYNFGLTPVYGLIDRAVNLTHSAVTLFGKQDSRYTVINGATKPQKSTNKPSTDTSIDNQPDDKKSEEAAVAAASSGNVLGPITRKTIGGGSLIYDKIRLNNKSNKDINIKKSLSQKIDLSVSGDSPEVFIYHTHATESYVLEERDYYTDLDLARNTDNSKNVTAVGEKIAKTLNSGGIQALHDRTQHDHPAYSGSYKRSAETMKDALKKHPSTQIMIDIHRDSIPDGNGGKTAAVCEIGGKKAAQVMLIVSTGYKGSEQNFAFALKFQQTLEVLYPGLARPMIVYESVYNQNLAPFCLLIEVGTDANSLDEALYSGELLGNALTQFLNDYK